MIHCHIVSEVVHEHDCCVCLIAYALFVHVHALYSYSFSENAVSDVDVLAPKSHPFVVLLIPSFNFAILTLICSVLCTCVVAFSVCELVAFSGSQHFANKCFSLSVSLSESVSDALARLQSNKAT